MLQYLELKSKFPNKNDNFRKTVRTLKNLYVNFKNLRINKKYLKVYANCKNEVQTRFTNCIAADFFINNCCIVTIFKTKK